MLRTPREKPHQQQVRQMTMKSISSAPALIALLFAIAFPAKAGTVSGTVMNGTTNRPVAATDVILLALQGGMQPVATVKTDSSGHFTINSDSLGTAPMLLRVPYKGVLYHEPVPPNTPTVQIEVYEPTNDPHSFAVTTREIVVQPQGSDLAIAEQYIIQNQTHPPVAYYLKDGTFRFKVPQGAQLNQVSASGSAGMPVIQGTIDKGNGVEAVDWPFRPGENGVRISYQMPYGSHQATIQAPSVYDVQNILLAVPPGMQVSADGFSAAGTEQGFEIYTHSGVAANFPISISLSGVASAPAPGSDTQDPSVNSRADSADAASSVTTLPPRLDNNVKYILVAGFAGLFILGVIFLWRRPLPQTAGAMASSSSAIVAPPAQITTPPAAPIVDKAERVEREATRSLDELKETLFRLELRHQAGTISDDEYARERERTQKILRDFLKG